MARKINCFISFSATDSSERDVRFLASHLSERLDGKVNFLIYSDQRSGADLQTFMSEGASTSEAVIALFSPDYKHKADNAVPSGVRTEHLHIVDRIEGRGSGPPMQFIPIYWRGPSFEAATPSYFVGRNLTRQLKNFQAYGTSGDPYLPDRVAIELRGEIDRIVMDLLSKWDQADPEYLRLKEQVENALVSPSAEPDDDAQSGDKQNGARERRPDQTIGDVFNPKHERQPNVTTEQFSARYFVKTAAFRAIGQNHKMAFTGRKGSGKTTLLKVYKHQHADEYFEPVDVEVNDWDLHYLLEDLTFKPAEGDLSYTAEESKIFDYIWAVFLSLCMVRSLCGSGCAKSSELIPKPDHVEQFDRACERYDALFQLAIGLVREFMSSSIAKASSRNEIQFKADLLRLLNVRLCVEHVLGKSYHAVLVTVQRDPSRRRFLFCLDRFDTEIQKYRKDLKQRNLSDAERLRREQREVFWIQGLVELIDNLRSPDQYSPNQEFYKLVGPFVDFCVPLPKDRLCEVQLRRRDAVVGNINEEINWQPYELLTMLRKRLQVLWRVPDERFDKSGRVGPRARFDAMVEASGRKLPTNSEIRMNGATFPLDLFLNVLRHTFFRPRDVILYYARIALALELAHKRGQKLPTSALSRYISDTTYKIVEEEFIGEFSDTFKNMQAVLHLFRGSPQVLGLADLANALDGVRFQIYAEDDIVDLGHKIRFLYELGFLGVRAEVAQLGGISSQDYDFYFFNPRIAPNLEQAEVLAAVRFAIHPVFIEYLTLKLNAPAPVLLLDWARVDELDYSQ